MRAGGDALADCNNLINSFRLDGTCEPTTIPRSGRRTALQRVLYGPFVNLGYCIVVLRSAKKCIIHQREEKKTRENIKHFK